MQSVDIVDFALSQHKLAGNAAISWTIYFVNGKSEYGTIRDYGGHRYSIISAKGPVYFSPDKVAYLHPGA